MDTAEFRAHAHRLVDWMADYLETIGDRDVRAAVEPGAVLARLPTHPPEEGEAMADILRDFETLIVPGMSHWQHPRWFAYFPANSSPPSVLAEMLTATLAAQCMSWETSPAATELETRVMEWLRAAIGLSDQWVGAIHDTASTATLCAMLAARERVTASAVNARGLSHQPPLVMYCSAEAHSSVEKDVKIVGVGREYLRKIPVDGDLSMDAAALDAALTADRDAGLLPTCVVATLGTTGASGFDSLTAIGAVCQRHGVWLHVDAAWAGSALVVPETRWMLEGVDLADSFLLNPHKWLFTNFDCSALYVRDVAHYVGTFEILPEYLKTRHGAAVTNYRDWGIQLGRRFRALKLWFVLRSYGLEGLRELIRGHLAMAVRVAEAVDAAPDFELVRAPRLSLLCLRYRPEGVAESDLDALNERLLGAVNDTGQLYVTHARLHGHYVMRFVVGQRSTTSADVDAAWATITTVARGLRHDAGSG